MADKKFSQFTTISPLTGSEEFVGFDGPDNIRAGINAILNYIGASISQFIILYETDANWASANLTLAEGFILVSNDDMVGDPKFKITDGVNAWADLPYFSTKIGLIQIDDKNGDFFTDLASATAYIEQFITPSVITDKSFNEGIFFFTVPPFTLVSGSFLTDNITPSVTYASLIDRFGLLDLISCGDLFYMNAGHHIIGDGYFSYSAFNFFTGSVEMNSLFITASGGNFAESSTGKFIIKGRIGINETAQFGVNFFLNSTATIFANASKYTSNAGGIHGDLQRAIINGCNVFFDGIDKEDKRNKGVANGYVPLNSSAKIDSTYLPSYVDDVVEGYLLSNVFYEESSHITVIAASTGKIYIDLTAGQKNKEYRYSGSLYVQITNGLIATTDDVTEGSSNLYFTIARVLATALTGINTALTGFITSSDTILTAFGRIQNQVTAIVTELSNYATLTGTETLTNKTIKKRILVVTQSATPSTNIDNGDIIQITGLAQAITSMTTNLTGTPYDGQMIMWQVTDNGTARALTLGSAFAASTNVALPTTTVAGVMLTWITMYKSGIAKHEVQYVN